MALFETVLSADASWGAYAAASMATGAFLLTLNYVNTRWERSKLPPGPTPLPFVGSALKVLGRPLHVTFADLREKYGDIFSIRIAGTEVVVINGYEAINDALVKDGKSFSGRPDITWTHITQKHGIFSSEGSMYKAQKKLIRSILTEIGWDKSDQAEIRISEIADNLTQWISETTDKPVDPQLFLDTAVCNVTSVPVMGAAFKPTADLMQALSKITADIFVDAGAQNVNNYFTFLRSFPGDPTNYQVLINNATTAMGVVAGVVSSHKEKFTQSQGSPELTDFIDHYLAHMSKNKEETCTERQLIAVVTDLIAMGIEATSVTLRWSLLLLSQHADIQQRLQDELDDVIGPEKPQLQHQSNMHLMNAVISEIQRYVNLVSINLPHSATQDVKFKGYNIAKGTVIIPNLASIHFDEQTYPEPLKFNPDRFIVDNEFRKPEKLMPYSTGTRMCLGKNLSQWQIFLMLTSVLQRFNVRLSDEGVGDDVYGLIRYPGNFKLIFSERNNSNQTTGIA